MSLSVAGAVVEFLNRTYRVLKSLSVFRLSSSWFSSPVAIAMRAFFEASLMAFETGFLDLMIPPSVKIEPQNDIF